MARSMQLRPAKNSRTSELTRGVIIDAKTTYLNKLKMHDSKLFVMARDVNFACYDPVKGENIWKAKNLPPDELNLKPKINNVDCCFDEKGLVYMISGFRKVE